MKVIKSELAFGIAGKAWAAISSGDEVIEIISMGKHRSFTGFCDAALKKAKRVRYCPASQRAAEELNTAFFLKHREESRAKLNKHLNCEVISGVASCGEFCIEEPTHINIWENL